jgi:sterol desaturase/sphingolipid hydroxylase (fatty acid hydroxylase superfamily)
MSEKAIVLLMILLNGVFLSLVERVAGRAGQAARRGHLRPNLVLTGLLVALNFGLDRVAAAAGRPLSPATGGLHRAGLPGWAAVLVVVVVLDGLTYAAHRLMHGLPLAWRFHRIHHSDAHVDVTTAFRQHPFETVWRYSFVCAGAMALGASTTAVAVYLALSALNAQLEHADVSLPWRVDGWLRMLFSTPAMHRIHHSRTQPETDRNYSNIFSAWDRLFGTYRAPRRGERIACGLDEFDAPQHQRTAGLLGLPFAASR